MGFGDGLKKLGKGIAKGAKKVSKAASKLDDSPLGALAKGAATTAIDGATGGQFSKVGGFSTAGALASGDLKKAGGNALKGTFGKELAAVESIAGVSVLATSPTSWDSKSRESSPSGVLSKKPIGRSSNLAAEDKGGGAAVTVSATVHGGGIVSAILRAFGLA